VRVASLAAEPRSLTVLGRDANYICQEIVSHLGDSLVVIKFNSILKNLLLIPADDQVGCG
jgi:hypothetical protein